MGRVSIDWLAVQSNDPAVQSCTVAVSRRKAGTQDRRRLTAMGARTQNAMIVMMLNRLMLSSPCGAHAL